MKISTKGRYALRMMLEFAMSPDHTTKINQVAKHQGISEKYLEQIVSILVKANYVKSVRGAQGGYLLTRPASEYIVGDILRLTEGSLAPVSCLDGETPPECGRDQTCSTKKLFQRVQNAVNSVIDHTTLQDLLEDEMSCNAKYRQQLSQNDKKAAAHE